MAISKERLEELIEQGATIWHDDYGEINLDKKSCEICELRTLNDNFIGWVLCFAYEYENVENHTEVNIEHLEEDVETAKWHYEMDCSREMRLILPTWEQFYEEGETKDFYCEDKKTRFLDLDYAEEIICCQEWNSFVTYETIKRFPLTKDGYLSACRLAKKLFLGEE